MEEKGIETNNKNQSSNKSNYPLMAIDELYYKLSIQQKQSRSKSANIINNNKNFTPNNNHFSRNKVNEKIYFYIKEKNNSNNSIEYPLFSGKNSIILDNRHQPSINKINMTNLININDSTKQSTKSVRIFTGKTNSINNNMNRTKLIENKRKVHPKQKLVSLININAEIDDKKNNKRFSS